MTHALAASTALSLRSRATGGSSGEAHYIGKQVRKGLRRLRDSNSLGAGIGAAIDELHGVAEDCRSANWDGYGAAPVSLETLEQASRFLEALPLGTSAPAVGAEPDGHVTLEWYHSPRRTLSVSVSSEGELHYAALLGFRKAYGTEPFFGEIPQVILQLIHRVVFS